MPSFLANTLFYMGLNPIVKREQDLKQAQAEREMALADEAKTQAAMLRQRQQTSQQIGSMIQAAQAQDKAKVQNPLQMADLYDKAQTAALAGGDFESARMYADMSKKETDKAKEQQLTVAKQIQEAKDNLASDALNMEANPNQENYNKLVQSAARAGVNPTGIPKPGTPEFTAFVKQQQTAGMTAKDRVELMSKQQEAEANRKLRWQEHQDSERDKALQRQQTAMLRGAMLSISRERLGLEREHLNIEKEKLLMQKDKAAHPQLTAQERSAITAIVGSASEATRGIKIIEKMPPSATSGPFTGLHDGTVMQALTKTGANKVTTQDMQMYQTVTKGLGLELGRVLTLGGGRGVNQAQINELQELVTVRPGDTNYEAMFKLSNAAEIVRNRLHSLPDHPDTKMNKMRDDVLKDLDKIPPPDQVYAAAKKAGKGKGLLEKYGSMGEAMGKITAESQQPAPSSLPSGWSVTVK